MKKSGQPQIEFRDLGSLIPYARNARTHSPEQVAQIAGLITEFGWTNPILADGTGIVAGHGRTMAARLLYDAGKTIYLPDGTPILPGTVPVLDVSGWSDAKRRAYILADNKAALNAGWDNALLAIEFAELSDLGLDLSLTAFDPTEIEVLTSLISEPEAGAGEGDGEEVYSRKIEAPIYEPSGEPPPVSALFNDAKAKDLISAIRAAELPADVALFLAKAAERHTVFDFARIADFYAHAEPHVQRLMEASALVIVDLNSAIENGFVKLTKRLGNLADAAEPEAIDA